MWLCNTCNTKSEFDCDLFSDVEEEEQGNDWLFTVIEDIVSTHNMVIRTLDSTVKRRKLCTLANVLPEKAPTAYLSEMDETNCLIGKLTK